ncbi:MAG: phosphate ABC transporter permease [Moorea sp. SIO3C2]|nr:phosphate ABC transporter permease [Moorena sp. SIO3C2]
MLIPITREKFEQIVPVLATGLQYRYYWGKFRDFLRRLLISLIAVVVILILALILGSGFVPFRELFEITAGLYWLWGPVYWATMRNLKMRRYAYSGFWQGRIEDVFVTEELIGTEEQVNQRGELVIVEHRERRLNLEVEDETGFMSQLQAPLQSLHKNISPGQIAQMLVMSNQPDLGKIAQTSDIYIPSLDIWVNDYPYLQRDVFVQVSRKLRNQERSYSRQRPRSSRRRRSY